MQYVIVVETNKKCQSDYLYIRSFLSWRYELSQPLPKFTAIYLGGKSRYFDEEKSINKAVAAYAFTGGESRIIFCLDTDSGRQGESLNEAITTYCTQKGYFLVWFRRDVEEVFQGHGVPQNRKGQEAERYLRANSIQQLDAKRLHHSLPLLSNGDSNIAMVFDAFLSKK